MVFIHISKTGGQSITASMKDLPELKLQDDSHRHILHYEKHLREDYFSFAFVRNPWDRMVSRFFYRQKKAQSARPHSKPRFQKHCNKDASFEDFMLNPDPYKIKPKFTDKWLAKLADDTDFLWDNCLDWITDDSGEIMVDFIGRFENLEEDFLAVQKLVGFSTKLPHLNKCSNDQKKYWEFYTAEARDMIAEKFSRDIAAFGYKFGE